MKAFAAAALLLTLTHGDADWITQNTKTKYCCGPRDCQVIEDVRYSPSGWIFMNPHTNIPENVPFDYNHRYTSIDDQYWACFNLGPESKPIRCFFTPNPGV